MTKLEEFRDFVKQQADFHLRMANKFKDNAKRNVLHLRTADMFAELYDFLDEMQSKRSHKKRLTVGWDEISDLPPELVSELSVSEADKTEFHVLKAIEDAGGVASLDRILVDYYKETGEVMKRAALNNRLYRMMQKGLMYPVPGRKGIYSLEEMSEDDAAELQ